MQIKSILAGAAIALAASVGSASAAEQFATLDGVSAAEMTPQEMGVVVGASAELSIDGIPASGRVSGGPIVGDVSIAVGDASFDGIDAANNAISAAPAVSKPVSINND